MTVSVVGRAESLQARDERVVRSAVSRTVTGATAAIKEGCKVATALVGILTVMIVLAALDVWIWVPHFGN
jgi:hypothetical protein